MRRLLTVLMVLVAVGYSQNPSLTNNEPNGLYWMQATRTERISMILAAEAGWHVEELEFAMVAGDCKHGPTYGEQIINANKTREDTAKEVDAFYNDGKNISLPLVNALLYADMKLAGAPQSRIDEVQRIIVQRILAK